MNKTILYHLLAFLLLFGGVSTTTAQVTFGADAEPSVFSVLELSTESTKGGLRLPHLTLTQRGALGFETMSAGPLFNAAQGLTIFNTTSQCIEYWDTREWISMCASSASFYMKTPPPVPAAGGKTILIQPEGGTPCSKNPPYTVEIVAGIGYVTNTSIVTDATLGQFQVEFYPNLTALPRYVIVRVTDNCTNLYRDLSIQQLANTALCINPATIPVLNSKAGGAGIDETMCRGGDVPLWLTNTNSAYTYIWTLNGVEISGAIGTTYVATKGGNYAVIVGAIGCPNSTSVIKKITEDTNPAGVAPLITATNGGVICAGGTVVLRAYNGVTPVASDWYQNGVLKATNVTSKSVNTATDAGIWTAIVSTACGSKQSNPLVVTFDNTTPGGLNPLALTINGLSPGSNPEICIGSSIAVEITNAADYAALNPIYAWFVNGVKVSEGSSPKAILSTPPVSNVTLEVQLTTSGFCPISTDYSKNVTTIELVKPRINDGRTEAFICGGSQVVNLDADRKDGVKYEWIRNGVVKEVTVGSNVNSLEAGTYQVRYQKGNCWSALSNPIELKHQAFLNLTWENSTPPTDKPVGTVMTIGVYTSPLASQYFWESSNPAVIKVTPLPSDNRYATIEYLVSGTATIKVRATNECGYKEISAPLTAGSTACVPIANLNFVRKPASAIVGSSLTYEVGYTGGGATLGDHKFDWVVKNGAGVVLHTSNLSGAAGKTFSYTFAAEGTYRVEVTAYDVCQTDPLTRMNIAQAVIINPDITTIPVAPGKYGMTGLICYDIAKSGLGMPRKSTFLDANGNEKYDFDYKLVGIPMTNIKAYAIGGGASILLAGPPTVNGTTITLHFDKASVNSVDANGISFVLVAVFSDGTNQYKIEKTITVQDKACCGAVTVGGGWLDFMCHNLGADENLDPFTHNVGLYGDLYQWGRKADGHEKRTSGSVTTLATTNTPNHANFIKVSAAPYDWRSGGNEISRWGDGTQNENQPKSLNDPCPLGWKVPSAKQWTSIFSNMTTPNEWKWTGNGYMVGASLYLPATGKRHYSNASLEYTGYYGFYWSSTVYDTRSHQVFFNNTSVSPASHNVRTYGVPIRCVAE